MSLRGRTLVVLGEVHAKEDLIIEGRIEGSVWSDGHLVTVADAAEVAGDITARTIVVLGAVDGTLLATDRVRVASTGRVKGRVVAGHFAIADGGVFNGRVEPQHLELASQVARHKHARAADGESGETA